MPNANRIPAAERTEWRDEGAERVWVVVAVEAMFSSFVRSAPGCRRRRGRPDRWRTRRPANRTDDGEFRGQGPLAPVLGSHSRHHRAVATLETSPAARNGIPE